MRPSLRKIRKLILHPNKYFYDYFYKKFKLRALTDQICTINKKLDSLDNGIHRLNIYNRNTGFHGFLFAAQDKIFPEDFIRVMQNQIYKSQGYFPDFNNPRSFNEKLNWLKFNYFNPNETTCVDKSTAKTYFVDKVGQKHVIPMIGIYDDVNNINFEELPESFVLKNTSSGGGFGVRIIRKKSEADLEKLKFELNSLLFKWSNESFLYGLNPKRREIKLRLIAEDYIEQLDGIVYDYKFFCFHGEAKFLYIAIPINGKRLLTCYDLNFKRTPYQLKNYSFDFDPTPPHNFKEMISIANTLSQEFPFVRVDLYSVDGKIYVGELTFEPFHGCVPFLPEHDFKIGNLLDLNKVDKEYIGHWEAGYKFIYNTMKEN